MKLSLEWLKEYVELPAEVTPEQIMYDLTMCTVEVESLHDQASPLADIFVGVVKEIKKHPDADRLSIAVTDLGAAHGLKEIVCGGSNLEQGMAVVVAVPGSWVHWHGESEATQLKETKVRGVKSFGMICASDEVGLGALYPAKSEKEIVNLEDPNAVPGTPLADYLGYHDTILDIDNKSLTNRPDLWGHYGVARELAAIYKCPLKPLPEFPLDSISTSGPLKVNIENQELCQRFMACVVEGVVNGESPLWLRSRLARVGQRPINLLVDITNYVMFAIGKPTHAFEQEQISDCVLSVRNAQAGESLELLDGNTLELGTDTLIVADAKKPLALAGVMGGLGSGVSEKTSNIILESANFSANYIRKVAKRYDVRTESSMRFEKGLDADATLISQSYLLHILSTIQDGIKVSQLVDCYPAPQQWPPIEVSTSFIESRIGMKVAPERIKELLESLGFGVTCLDEQFKIDVPAWRATGDVSLAEDIVEEIARLLGYDNLEFEAIPVNLEHAIRQPDYELDQSIRSSLAFKSGLQEVVTYPWVNDKFIHACGLENVPAIELSAPPAPDIRKLKTSLAPSLLEIAEKNTRFFNDFGLFEISRVFHQNQAGKSDPDTENLPVQPKTLGAIAVSSDAQTAVLNLKGAIEEVFNQIGVSVAFNKELDDLPEYLESIASLKLVLEGEVIGHLGLMSRRTMRRAGISRHSVAIATVTLEKLYTAQKQALKFRPVPKYPEIEYDLSIVFDRNVSWENISATVEQSDPLIKQVEFIDEYTGKQIPENKKSIAFKMFLGDEQSTLTSEQAESAANKVLKNLQSELSGEIRS